MLRAFAMYGKRLIVVCTARPPSDAVQFSRRRTQISMYAYAAMGSGAVTRQPWNNKHFQLNENAHSSEKVRVVCAGPVNDFYVYAKCAPA